MANDEHDESADRTPPPPHLDPVTTGSWKRTFNAYLLHPDRIRASANRQQTRPSRRTVVGAAAGLLLLGPNEVLDFLSRLL